jgi:hypothetical protein
MARGAAAGLLLAVIPAFANQVLAGQDPKPALALFATYVLVVAGFLLGGFAAGREAPWRPSRHGLGAALIVFVPIEAIAILGRLDRGTPISLPGIVILGFIAAAAGHTGGIYGGHRPTQRPGGSS